MTERASNGLGTPQTAATRLAPPRRPPAPPGTGHAPQPGRPREHGLGGALEDCLDDLAVIQTIFETLSVLPGDEDLGGEMRGMIEDARGNLVLHLEEGRRSLHPHHPRACHDNYGAFQECVLEMAARGIPGAAVDRELKTDAFEGCREGADPCLYEFQPPLTAALMRQLPPDMFMDRLLEDVLDTVIEEANYAGKAAFDATIFRKIYALLFAWYSTSAPA
jgi:hypothetical protein